MLHGNCWVDGGYFDPAAYKILHNYVAWQHRSDISGQRLMRQRGITCAKYSIIPELDLELLLHRRFDIDTSQNAETLGLGADVIRLTMRKTSHPRFWR